MENIKYEYTKEIACHFAAWLDKNNIWGSVAEDEEEYLWFGYEGDLQRGETLESLFDKFFEELKMNFVLKE